MSHRSFVFQRDSAEVIRFLEQFCTSWSYFLTFSFEATNEMIPSKEEMHRKEHHQFVVTSEGTATQQMDPIEFVPGGETGVLILHWLPARAPDALWAMTLLGMYAGSYGPYGRGQHAENVAEFRLFQERSGECQGRLSLPEPGSVLHSTEYECCRGVWEEAGQRMGEFWRALLIAWGEYASQPAAPRFEQNPVPRAISTEAMPPQPKPWEAIPPGRDREVVRLWHEGLTNSEIADELRRLHHTPVEPVTVTKTLSTLRKSFGHEVVPTDQQRRRRPGQG